ncbi:MAG TPA: hypothetical protein VNF24_10310 [Candidatus Acidoferrales bacterium]|nr:hypothetical protein [Candidatus Acidoferrales bacterium]
MLEWVMEPAGAQAPPWSSAEIAIVTTGERPDLDGQVRAAFRAVWPEFIFHDPASGEYLERVEAYFPHLDILLVDRGKCSLAVGGLRSHGRELSQASRTATTEL